MRKKLSKSAGARERHLNAQSGQMEIGTIMELLDVGIRTNACSLRLVDIGRCETSK